MPLCSFCSSIPLDLFSFQSDKQCTVAHHPSVPVLQASALAGCQFCNLCLHAIQQQIKDGEYDDKTGAVTLASTKFDGQRVQIDYRHMGNLRGRILPSEWCRPRLSYYC
jgi:hypothetical protein